MNDLKIDLILAYGQITGKLKLVIWQSSHLDYTIVDYAYVGFAERAEGKCSIHTSQNNNLQAISYFIQEFYSIEYSICRDALSSLSSK